MWTCGALKKRAWGNLKKYYWMAFLACIIVGFLGGGEYGIGANSIGKMVSSGIVNAVSVMSEMDSDSVARDTSSTESLKAYNVNITYENMDYHDPYKVLNWIMIMSIVGVIVVGIVIPCVISIIWTTFMGNPVRVGICRFFLESRQLGASASLGRIFYVFDKAKYLNVIKVMFLRKIFIFLWSLLFIVPGIIKSYDYALVPYILSDNPNMDYKRVLATSKIMMQGHKLHLWVLHLSFIGWHLLGLLCCCIGGVFVTPYVEATIAELYAELRSYPCTDAGLML